ncbi:hypothetical protein MHPYR_120114 [uncultured Mycobacterium sp.]|uniref:Uncharacterized protein n=1 Tax=uncultured Mycobacterium sp. TaxID=171292 RepID=A0A1Y5P759_9MYCO|nr:hypothetical protein MHPYR_120114 [uncultured Mycobacterium sp.]
MQEAQVGIVDGCHGRHYGSRGTAWHVAGTVLLIRTAVTLATIRAQPIGWALIVGRETSRPSITSDQ